MNMAENNNNEPVITYQNEVYLLQIIDLLQQVLSALTGDNDEA